MVSEVGYEPTPKYVDQKQEIGTLKNIHHIEIKDNVAPKVTPIRKIPFEAEIRKGIKMYG